MLNTKDMLGNISKGQSAINVKYIIQGLEQYYQSVIGKIRPIYIEGNDSSLTYFFNVPSSSLPIEYDVVIEFHNFKQKITTSTPFRVYCNSPSFYFAYGNTFKRLGSLLYPEKYPSLLKVPAKVRNAADVAAFDKYIYSCLRYSISNSITDIAGEVDGKPKPHIKSFSEKQDEYLKLKQRLKNQESD